MSDDVRPSSERMWRTPVWIESVNRAGGYMYVTVPAHFPRIAFFIPLSSIPEAVRNSVELMTGTPLYARVNIGAERACDVQFTDWEAT